MSNIVKLDVNNFKKEVLEAKGLVLVDFWADWCGPCKMLGPILDELSTELELIKIAKVNVDESGELAGEYGIRSIPTMIIFKDGQKVDQIVGLRQKAELKELLLQY
ncbi:thioredoxin [Cetobacterium ceti]|uniref:Thioredoxin n=1 Tax=Cetobacterium ceti TaxID=180163 RepID=A0A1T4KWU0_9FUSO|nr:thioredoxin [Cetobacterium ceti]SJZ46777.1 thioredoxin [Cetobacterium ceti]